MIKQFIYEGLEEYALELCCKGRISIGKIAELLDRSIYDIQEMAKEKGIWGLGVKTKITKTGNSLAVRIPKK